MLHMNVCQITDVMPLNELSN